MVYFLFKTLITGLVVAGVSIIARRSSVLAALLASLPLTSILALIWLYRDTGDTQATASLSTNIFWMVLPSLLFFIIFPWAIKRGWGFYPALLLSCVIMVCAYGLYGLGLKRLGITL